MANDFKNITRAQIGTAPITIYTAPGPTVIIGFSLANVLGMSVEIGVDIYDASVPGNRSLLSPQTPLPVGSTMIITDQQKIVLEVGDSIIVSATVDLAVDAVLSVLEL